MKLQSKGINKVLIFKEKENKNNFLFTIMCKLIACNLNTQYSWFNSFSINITGKSWT